MSQANGPNGVQPLVSALSRIASLLFMCGGAALGDGQPVARWTQIPRLGPPAKSYHAMAYDDVRQVTVLFGGVTDNYRESAETWEWDGTHWTQRLVAGPPACRWHAMAYDRQRGVVVLFGSGPYFTETWEWDGTAWTLHEPMHRPTPRFSSLAAANVPMRPPANLKTAFHGAPTVLSTLCPPRSSLKSSSVV